MTIECPFCGLGYMVRRTNRETGEKFLGCSEFPECKGVMEDKPQVLEPEERYPSDSRKKSRRYE